MHYLMYLGISYHVTNAKLTSCFNRVMPRFIEGRENIAISYFILILIAPIELNN